MLLHCTPPPPPKKKKKKLYYAYMIPLMPNLSTEPVFNKHTYKQLRMLQNLSTEPTSY